MTNMSTFVRAGAFWVDTGVDIGMFIGQSKLITRFCDDTWLGGSGGIPPWKIFEIWSWKQHFLDFEGTYEPNAKVLNHFFLKAYFMI